MQGDKRIIMPSFGTTSALFARHFEILRTLKRRIDLLKQAYFAQADNERTWDQVDKILDVLEQACEFLSVDDMYQS